MTNRRNKVLAQEILTMVHRDQRMRKSGVWNTKVHYKTPLSGSPLNNHAVVGWFSYKKARTCFKGIKEMLAQDLKSGPEFSLDECTNILLKNKTRIRVFEVQTFISWGTPIELKTYEYWQRYFSLKTK